MQQINETEQWLLEGDCKKCRKEKYCGKGCKANDRFVTRQAMRLGMKLAAEALSPLMQAARDKEELYRHKDKEDDTDGTTE